MTKEIIRLHHVPFSRSFRVLWMLEEMGMAADVVDYAISDGSMRQEDFLAKSPAGRVPALEIDGKVLFESGAILEYLAETRPGSGLGRAVGDEERQDYLTWLHFAETQAHILANLNLQHLFLRDASMRSPTVLKIEAARLRASLKVMDDALHGRDWLLASGFSAADIMYGFNLFAAPYYADLDEFAALKAYIARIEARPAYAAARAKDGVQAFYRRDFYNWDDT